MFQDGGFASQCEQLLDQMNKLAQQLLKLSQKERSLQERHEDHRERYEKLKLIVADTHLQLKQLPERWKDYHQKYVPL